MPDQVGLRHSDSIPRMMPLARVHDVNDLRVDQVEIPPTGPRDVLIRVGATGVCGSDLGYLAAGGLNEFAPRDQPLALGHEFAGIVEQVGSEVKDIFPGQRCAVNPDGSAIGCGGPAGAFAPFVLVQNARLGGDICPIPATLSLEKAALAEPLSVALHGINIANPTRTSKVVVLGAGPIGLCTVICLRYRGVADIVVADLSDSRLERAKQLGASTIINSSREALADRIGEVQGTGDRFGMPYIDTDIFLDAAGSSKALDEVLNVAKFRAKIVVIALHKKPLPINLWKMMANEFSITGSIATDREDEFNECLRMLAEDNFDVAPLISQQVPFDQVEDAFRLARDLDASAKVIVTFPQA
jgi:threonine dehydrogenase-like Zn-dependent dehydrogenase